jgi:hypothetical protein
VGEYYSFGKMSLSPSLIHIFHAFCWWSQLTITAWRVFYIENVLSTPWKVVLCANILQKKDGPKCILKLVTRLQACVWVNRPSEWKCMLDKRSVFIYHIQCSSHANIGHTNQIKFYVYGRLQKRIHNSDMRIITHKYLRHIN